MWTQDQTPTLPLMGCVTLGKLSERMHCPQGFFPLGPLSHHPVHTPSPLTLFPVSSASPRRGSLGMGPQRPGFVPGSATCRLGRLSRVCPSLSLSFCIYKMGVTTPALQVFPEGWQERVVDAKRVWGPGVWSPAPEVLLGFLLLAPVSILASLLQVPATTDFPSSGAEGSKAAFLGLKSPHPSSSGSLSKSLPSPASSPPPLSPTSLWVSSSLSLTSESCVNLPTTFPTPATSLLSWQSIWGSSELLMM